MKLPTHKPHWIPIEKLNFFDRKLLLTNKDENLMGAGVPKSDGTFDWGWKNTKPTHYWSF